MSTYVRPLAIGGLAATVAAVVLVGALHVVAPSSQLNPVRATISHYALLDNGWVFDLALLMLAAGSLATMVALAAAGVLRPGSLGGVALALWCVSLVGVVVFEKHDWSVGPTVNGDIHRLASALTFLSLPVAALALGRLWWRDPRWAVPARAGLVGAVLSLFCIAPVVWAIATEPDGWWRVIPLGAVERAIALCEVATILVLASWAVTTKAR